MNKNRFFRMNFGGVKLGLMAIVVLGAFAVIGLDIAILSGAIATSVPEAAWASLVAAALVAAATFVLFFGSGYSFDDKNIVVRLGIFKDKLAYDSVTELKRNGESGEYFVIMGDMINGTNVRINVLPSERDDFVAELRKHLPAIAVETFVLPKKDKKEK